MEIPNNIERKKMKRALLKNSFKAISKNKKRFLSMFFMALLGVGFFAGLTASGPDMKDTLDKYLDETKTYDINILATLGLTNEDVKALEEIDGVDKAYGIQYKDYLIEMKDKEYVAQIIEYNEKINNPYIVEGNLPKNNNECLLDEKFAEFNHYKIGDTIKIKAEDENLRQKELVIVGICKSPLYIAKERGNTTLGTGIIDAYIYTNDILDFDYYSTIYIHVKGAEKLHSQSKKYEELIEETKRKIEDIKEEREQERYHDILNTRQKQLAERQELLSLSGTSLEQREIENMEIAENKWYIQTRKDNSGYYGIVQAIESITNLAGVFPIVFYVIAVLISLTSMTRMIEEERTEIGTLKAIRLFAWKYLI